MNKNYHYHYHHISQPCTYTHDWLLNYKDAPILLILRKYWYALHTYRVVYEYFVVHFDTHIQMSQGMSVHTHVSQHSTRGLLICACSLAKAAHMLSKQRMPNCLLVPSANPDKWEQVKKTFNEQVSELWLISNGSLVLASC